MAYNPLSWQQCLPQNGLEPSLTLSEASSQPSRPGGVYLPFQPTAPTVMQQEPLQLPLNAHPADAATHDDEIIATSARLVSTGLGTADSTTAAAGPAGAPSLPTATSTSSLSASTLLLQPAVLQHPPAATTQQHLPPLLQQRPWQLPTQQQPTKAAPSYLHLPPHLRPRQQDQSKQQQQPQQPQTASFLPGASSIITSSSTAGSNRSALLHDTAADPLRWADSGSADAASAWSAARADVQLTAATAQPVHTAAAAAADEEASSICSDLAAWMSPASQPAGVQRIVTEPESAAAVTVSHAAAWPTVAASVDQSTAAPAPAGAHAADHHHQQQYAPKQPGPTLSAMLDRLKRDLHGGSGSRGVNFSLREGLKWLQGYDPTAADVVDNKAKQYLSVISKDQGPAVAACVVFFAMDHHDSCGGDTQNLCLYTADRPAKLLQKRLTYYRSLFSGVPTANLELLTTLVVHRPDVAGQLSRTPLDRLFDQSTDAESAAAVIAGLLLLPEGWEGVCQPRAFVTSFVTAVLQDASNAEKMVQHIANKVAAAAATSESVNVSSNTYNNSIIPRAVPADSIEWHSGGSSSSSSSSGGITALDELEAAAAAAPYEAALDQVVVKQQQQQHREAHPRFRGTGPNSAAWANNHHQQRPTAAAAVSEKASRLSNRSRRSEDSSSRSSLGAADAAATGGNAAGGSSSSSKANIVELALVQLQRERPDVVMHATRDLRDRIKTLDHEAAVAAVGELMLLPRGWAEGLGKAGKPQPRDYLNNVVSRAAAHAAAAAGSSATPMAAAAGGAEDEWVVQGSSSGSRPDKQAVAAAWARLASDKPWLGLDGQHKAELNGLTAEQQMQVISVVNTVSQQSSSLDAADYAARNVMKIIQNAISMITSPAPPELQAALSKFARNHPDVWQYIDAGVQARIHGIARANLAKALAALKALEQTSYPPGWDAKLKNPAAWLMGIINTGLGLRRSGSKG